MPRAVRLDLAAPLQSEVVDILPSPPPAYSALPIDDRFEDADETDDSDADGEEFLVNGEEDLDDLSDDDDEDGDDDYGIDDNLVGDQDWENAAGDLTKRYNRLRQHVGALTGEQSRSAPASGIASNAGSTSSAMPLPAQNQHRIRSSAATSAANSGTPNNASTTSNGAPTGVHTSKLESSLAALSNKYSAALNLGMVGSSEASTSALPYGAQPSFTSNAATRKGGSERLNIVKDKSDRATTEQVLDPRTRLILFKMLGRGLLEKVEGCVSTGKEANVYHALGRISPDAEPPSLLVHLALKIYKTSILTFKSRSKYLTGEFRFKNGYSKVKNPRKMIRLWAEKEMRNLKRMHTAGLRCPEPVEVRNNVLVMTFLGLHDDSWEACPRLKDADLPAERLEELYIEMLWIVRRLYKVCRLVHADLSEYNVLYNPLDEHLYTIDVSQSVEHDHPHAFDFLRSDIANMDEFFARRGVRTLGIMRTFGMIIETWGMDGEESELQIRTEVERRFSLPEATADANGLGDQVEQDKVFMQSYIPRTLNEVYDPERDVQRIAQGEQDQLIYSEVVGVVAPKAIKVDEDVDEQEDFASESGTEDESGDGDDGAEGEAGVKQSRGKRHEDRDAKRERKQAVKEEKREKRKDKIPKSVKKAAVKKHSGKNRK